MMPSAPALQARAKSSGPPPAICVLSRSGPSFGRSARSSASRSLRASCGLPVRSAPSSDKRSKAKKTSGRPPARAACNEEKADPSMSRAITSPSISAELQRSLSKTLSSAWKRSVQSLPLRVQSRVPALAQCGKAAIAVELRLEEPVVAPRAVPRRGWRAAACETEGACPYGSVAAGALAARAFAPEAIWGIVRPVLTEVS